MNSRDNKKVLINTAFLIVGILVGSFVLPYFSKSKNEFGSCLQNDADYLEERRGFGEFTNPLLSCDNAREAISNPLNVSKFKIEALINKKIADHEADFISVYFRDLNNGPWFGIEEKSEFIGGSLLKVPLMIAYLKDAETNPDILQKKIRYGKLNPQVSLNQFFQPSEGIKVGNDYTVWELIEYMIKYSDNNAADILGQNIDPRKILDTFSSLGIGLPDFNKPYPTSTRTYGSFFRILFNASYLNTELSERALELLSQAEFSKGIRSGVPLDIPVSHKFGIREIGDSIGKQLHDCGIIYFPKHPYLLCVMTRGADFNKLGGVIHDISEMVYKEISSQKLTSSTKNLIIKDL